MKLSMISMVTNTEMTRAMATRMVKICKEMLKTSMKELTGVMIHQRPISKLSISTSQQKMILKETMVIYSVKMQRSLKSKKNLK